MNDELVEHVAEDGTVLELVTRTRMRHAALRHRCVYIAVITSAGELVVHRRADWKDLWPGRWDLAFGGVVAAGEAWDAAARRELAEEAGIAGVELTPIGGGRYDDRDVHVVGRAYRVDWGGAVVCTDGEVAETARVALADLDGWISGRSLCPDTVALVRPLLA